MEEDCCLFPFAVLLSVPVCCVAVCSCLLFLLSVPVRCCLVLVPSFWSFGLGVGCCWWSGLWFLPVVQPVGGPASGRPTFGVPRLGVWVSLRGPCGSFRWTNCIYSCVLRASWFIPNLGPTTGNFFHFFVCVYQSNNHAHIQSKRAIIGTIPALALTPAPTLAGILDDLEKQLGPDIMKAQVTNIMQHSAKSFILHLAKADQVEAFMARGLTFRGHLLEFARPRTQPPSFSTGYCMPCRKPASAPPSHVMVTSNPSDQSPTTATGCLSLNSK